MKKYETPLLEEDSIEIEDIIATSGSEGFDAGDSSGNWQPVGKSW